MKTIGKDLASYFQGEPMGSRTNGLRYLQKLVAEKAAKLPYEFNNLSEWENKKAYFRKELPSTIGIPTFPPMGQSRTRSRSLLDDDVILERVDVDIDGEYGIPAFVYTPNNHNGSLPGIVYNPGWPQDKWDKSNELFAIRMARQGFCVIIIDHIPFGETSSFQTSGLPNMTLAMSMCHLMGISQLGFRAAETMRAGEYMRSRPDVNPKKVAVTGLCQGGMDTWLSAALDDGFCAAAPLCSASTFAIHMVEMATYFVNGDSSPFPFGILNLLDVDHLHAMIAPRPLMVRANLPDQWWPVSAFDAIQSFSEKIYDLYNAKEKTDFMLRVHEHNISGPFADDIEAFMLEYVK